MCVVAAKHFSDVGWALAKNRDRNYEPTIKMVQRKDQGVERLYLYDLETGYSEGLNEHGVSIISAAVAVKTDEKEGGKAKAKVNGTSPDGKRIRLALLEKTAKGALDRLIESKIPGNTFITDGRVCYLLESGYERSDENQEDYKYDVIKCDPNKTYVRTNHGFKFDIGYSDKFPEEKYKAKSSRSRQETAEKLAKNAKDAQEFLNALGSTPHKDPQMNPIRLKKNNDEDMLTTGQILIVAKNYTLTYRPTLSQVELDNYNKINGVKSKTYFEIISNRQLTTYKDFVTETRYIKKFSDFITEAADSAQNLHMTHADEDIFERGDKGALAAIEFITDVAKNLGKGSTKLTVKWDGAPAIFAGWDPTDNQFFVGTKSVFAKNPKVYKTQGDIAANESGGKAEKLAVCLQILPKVGIPKGKVLQGDMLYTRSDLKFETIDGKRYVVAHPNTLAYAWPVDSPTGQKIMKAQMGIVWHTTYTGKGDLSTYGASFGVDVSTLKNIQDCWQEDAYYKGADIAFSEGEYANVYAYTMKAKSLVGEFNKLKAIMDSIPSAAAGAGIKTYINSLIRNGQLPNPTSAAKAYIDYLDKYWEEKVIAKVKTDAAKDTKRAALHQIKQDLNKNMTVLMKAFEYVDLITKAKMIVVNKLNSLSKETVFVKTSNGYQVTAPEGFVAISGAKGEAVKFVDRLAFSHFNFSDTYIKGWQK